MNKFFIVLNPNMKQFYLSAYFIFLFGCFTCWAETTTVRIGMLHPLSGGFAAVGMDVQQGAALAIDEIDPSVKIEFIYADSKSEPAVGVSEFKKLQEIDKVSAIFAFRGPVGMAVNPISKKTGMPLLGGVGNKDFAAMNPYAFQLWPRSDLEGAFLAAKVAERNVKRIAMITVQDDWTIAFTEGFKDEFKKTEGEVVFDQEVLPSDNDFKSIITKIAKIKPDAVFANVALMQIAPFVRQMKEQGLMLPTFSNFWAGKKEVIESAKEAIEQVLFVDVAANIPQFREAVEKRFNRTPSGATLSGYTATILLAQAVKNISNPSPKSLYEELLKQHEVKTQNGTFLIKERCVQFPLALRVIKNGRVENDAYSGK